jgi:hypothetical protein
VTDWDDTERRADEELARVWRRLPIPSDEVLHDLAQSVSSETQDPPLAGRRRVRSRRWAVAVVGAALLAASGLGFGLGSSLTASGEAGVNVVGFGFIPVRGWSVIQTGSLDGNAAAQAVAANVRVHADDASGAPDETLRSLPQSGVLLWTTFRPRGDESVDKGFPIRTLPLRLVDADPVSPFGDPSAPSRLVRYRLVAGVGGYNIDTRVYFGSQPTAETRAAVQEQLDRLVVAASGVTLVVQPRVARDVSQRLTVFGSVESGKAGEKVAVQFKACGTSPGEFRDFLETTTRSGGGFSFLELQPFGPAISGVFRAVSGDSTSADVPITYHADVSLRYPRGGRTAVSVSARVSLWRRYVLLQRYDRTRGVWVNVRRIRLTEQGGGISPYPGPHPSFFGTETFRPGVPRGTQIRAVMPLSQARPCYLAGVSEVRRA